MYRRASNVATFTEEVAMKQLGLPTGAEEQYWTTKNQWQSFTPDQENRFAKWRELKHLISKYGNYMYNTSMCVCM